MAKSKPNDGKIDVQRVSKRPHSLNLVNLSLLGP